MALTVGGAAGSSSCRADTDCKSGERCGQPSPDATAFRCLSPCRVPDYSVIFENCPTNHAACMVDDDCAGAPGVKYKCVEYECVPPCHAPTPGLPCGADQLCVELSGTRIVTGQSRCEIGPALFCVDKASLFGGCATG